MKQEALVGKEKKVKPFATVRKRLALLWQLARPRHAIPILVDVFPILESVRERPAQVHLQAAIDWLCAAQDVVGEGISAGYSFRYGWLPPYPETTGYIIPTFFDCATASGMEALYLRAVQMAEWELAVQFSSGAIPSGLWGSDPTGHFSERVGPPSVFNTGQVIFGWCRTYRETEDERFLEAALRAGRWIVECQDEDGMWRRNLSPGPTAALRTYKSRVAWALAELYELTGELMLKKAAVRSLEWVLGQQQPNGYFQHASFDPDRDPLTHTIAYCIEGLLEGGALLGEERFLVSARRALEALKRRFELSGYLAATYNNEWSETAGYQCLTGNAQIARSWLRLYKLTGDVGYLNVATAVNRHLKRTQLLWPSISGVRGGIKGSHPIWGSRHGAYSRFTYLNWATKFFIDALLLEEKVKADTNNRPLTARQPALVESQSRSASDTHNVGRG